MMEILKISKKNSREIIKIAKKAILEGKVLIFPTDTVYGLLCDATNQKAVNRLFKIKKREKNKALPIFVKDLKMAKEFSIIGKKEERVLKKLWPGKVTIVFKKKRNKKLYGVEKETIALRIPKYKILNELLSAVKKPLTGTSANISGKPSSIKIKEVISQFSSRGESVLSGKNKKDVPDIVFNAGNLKKSLPSTIIDLTGKEIKILRKGVVKVNSLPYYNEKFNHKKNRS